MPRHANRIAIVTGAGSGIGRATALRLVAEGACVVGCSPTQASLDATAAACGSDALHLVAADLTDPAQLEHVVRVTLARHGRIDILANNAGISDGHIPLHELDDDTWNRVIAVNLTAAMAMCRRVVPVMMAQKAGAITHVGSVTSLVGSIGGLAYTASKHALVGLSRSIAAVYRDSGIRSNIVCPGAVDTGLDDAPRSEFGYAQVRKMHRMAGKLAAPDEIAAVISWLSSDEASNVNGAVMTVDAGWIA